MACAQPAFAVGDNVIALVNHMPGMRGTRGTVSIARAGDPPYYGVTLAGTASVHKWLAEDELDAAPGGK